MSILRGVTDVFLAWIGNSRESPAQDVDDLGRIVNRECRLRNERNFSGLTNLNALCFCDVLHALDTPSANGLALPQGAPNEKAAEDWLAVAHSKEGQEAFNPAKGSICARTDCDNEVFKTVPETYDYLTSAAEDWASDSIVPSVAHGAAAFESWATDWKDTISLFVASGDVAGTQEALQALCVDAGVCE